MFWYAELLRFHVVTTLDSGTSVNGEQLDRFVVGEYYGKTFKPC